MTTAVDHAPEQPDGRTRRIGVRVTQTIASLAVIVLLFAFAIPRIVGGYSQVWEQLRQLDSVTLLLLTGVWLFGLWVYANVYQRCLPGLRRLQGMVLQAAGGAISNIVPFGGAVGVGTTFGMSLSWGFAPTTVSATVLVTGLFNFFASLLLPVLALGLLVAEGRATWQLAVPAATGAVVIAVSVTFLALVERSEPTAQKIGDVLERLGTWLCRILHLHRTIQWKRALLDFRHQTTQILRAQWLGLSVTVLTYKLCQFILLLLCVRAVDPATTLSWIDVFAAFAFGRVLSAVPVTPGGVGVVEAGSIAALVALGADAASAGAAVLLFSGFVYALEIPLGGAAWIMWATNRRWRRPASPDAA